MVTLTIRLGPDDAARTLAGVEAIVMRNAPTAKPRDVVDPAADGADCASTDASASLARQRADAFVALVADGGINIETEVVLHVRGDGCSYDDGTPVTDTVVERLVSTSFLRALIHDAEGRPTNASSRRRHPSVRQKRVVRQRDRCCVDCGATELLEYDHVPASTSQVAPWSRSSASGALPATGDGTPGRVRPVPHAGSQSVSTIPGVASSSSSSVNSSSTISRMTSRGVKCSPAVSLDSSENFRISSSWR